MSEQRFSSRELTETASSVLQHAGMSDAQADVVAAVLVEADLMGHTTHGLNLLSPYLTELREGRMNVRDSYETVVDTPSTAVWDGRYISGVYLTQQAIDAALAKSSSVPVVTYTIRRAHHIACLAAYMPRIVEAGRIGILYASDPRAEMVAPFGGVTPVYSPNPIAAGIPGGPGGPIIVDVSTSATAGGTVGRAKKRGVSLAGEWLLTAEVSVTDDPNALDEEGSSILPLGGLDTGYKGYALGLIVEALTSGLSGFGRKDEPTNWGTSVFLQIIDPEGFSGLGGLEAEMSHLTDACRSSKPRGNAPPVRIPGDRALALKAEQLEHGVALPQEIAAAMEEECNRRGIPFPRAL
jgi:L-lactate dehydrogenase